MEVPYPIRPYFMGVSPYIGLKTRPYIWHLQCPHRRLVKLPGPTRGAAETVLIGLKSLPPERAVGLGRRARAVEMLFPFHQMFVEMIR